MLRKSMFIEAETHSIKFLDPTTGELQYAYLEYRTEFRCEMLRFVIDGEHYLLPCSSLKEGVDIINQTLSFHQPETFKRLTDTKSASRGGIRAGAGRKKSPNPKKPVRIDAFEQKLIALFRKVDHLSAQMKLNELEKKLTQLSLSADDLSKKK